MSDELRPLASLSSSLLARRGAARPAMRPQAIRMAHGITSPLEDLGWDDMGDEHGIAQDHALTHPVHTGEVLKHSEEIVPQPVASPAVTQQEEIERSFAPLYSEPEPQPQIQPVAEPAAPPVVEAAPVPVAAPVARPVARAKSKAAFTLRLDEERHLRLRLLCAMQHRSAQQLVTQALDDFLNRHSDQLVLPAAVRGLNPSTGDRT